MSVNYAAVAELANQVCRGNEVGVRNPDKFDALCEELDLRGVDYKTDRGRKGWHIRIFTEQDYRDETSGICPRCGTRIEWTESWEAHPYGSTVAEERVIDVVDGCDCDLSDNEWDAVWKGGRK